MSLAEDFSMYYSGSYVGVNHEGQVVPFLVNEVYSNRDIYNPSNFSREERRSMEYSKISEDSLVFRGDLLLQHETIQKDISFRDEDLILETPDPKYIKVRGGWSWITFRPSRTTKKGITNRKLVGVPSMTSSVLRKIFSEEEHDEVISGCYLKHNGKILYKGLIIGEYEGNNFTICRDAIYHGKILERKVEGCQVTMKK